MKKVFSSIMICLMILSAFSAFIPQVKEVEADTQPTGGTEWTKYTSNPLTTLGQDTVGDPWVILDGSTYKIWFRKWSGEAGIYYSTSSDGIAWATPVKTDLSGTSGSWDESILNPCVIYDGTLYRMWFSGEYGGRGRIGHATSTNGIS